MFYNEDYFNAVNINTAFNIIEIRKDYLDKRRDGFVEELEKLLDGRSTRGLVDLTHSFYIEAMEEYEEAIEEYLKTVEEYNKF